MVAVGEKLFAIVYLPASLCLECWELLPAVSRWETGIGWKLWTLSRYPFSENLAAYCSTNTGKAGFKESEHGLRTPNEGINQKNPKVWANVADKICFGRT